jgi:hypothetical protein
MSQERPRGRKSISSTSTHLPYWRATSLERLDRRCGLGVSSAMALRAACATAPQGHSQCYSTAHPGFGTSILSGAPVGAMMVTAVVVNKAVR